MRIVIEIQDGKVTSATVEGSSPAGGPPPDVLEAARARGAISAGRAPLNPPEASAPLEAGAARSRTEGEAQARGSRARVSKAARRTRR
jgi:hypothetical protein